MGLPGGRTLYHDSIWEEVTRHYDERALADLILSIALVNIFNRLNVTTRQVAGEWVPAEDTAQV